MNAVALLRGKHKSERLAGLLAEELLLEAREKHSCAMDVLQRFFCHSLVSKASVNDEFVAESYYRIFGNFHFIYLLIVYVFLVYCLIIH